MWHGAFAVSSSQHAILCQPVTGWYRYMFSLGAHESRKVQVTAERAPADGLYRGQQRVELQNLLKHDSQHFRNRIFKKTKHGWKRITLYRISCQQLPFRTLTSKLWIENEGIKKIEPVSTASALARAYHTLGNDHYFSWNETSLEHFYITKRRDWDSSYHINGPIAMDGGCKLVPSSSRRHALLVWRGKSPTVSW